MKKKNTILIIDDIVSNIRILTESLRDEYKIIASTSGKEAIDIINNITKPDLILLDIVMPELDGYEVCKILKSRTETSKIPIIFLTAINQDIDETKGFELGAVDYIRKPFSVPVVKSRIKMQLSLNKYQNYLEELVSERTIELLETQKEIVFRLAQAAEYRDFETGLHIKRLTRYCKLLGKKYGFKENKNEILFHASSMHDVGKIGIPDGILLKPAELDIDEREIMKKHTIYGAELLSGHSSQLLQMAKEIALTHHERWDGSGYPYGLKYEEIPVVGRITSICDVFDSLTSVRPYKKAWTVEKTIEEINNKKGKHFDPHLVDLFNEIILDIIEVKKEFE